MRLDDLTVLDFTHLLPGPYATQILADLGAEVIKIEPPGGEGGRSLDLGDGEVGSLFETVNRGKKSVELDLKADGAEPIVDRLFQEADAVIEQFRPGVARELGIGYDDATATTSELVYCSLSGYGQDGPYNHRVGHDLNYVATAGLLDMNRENRDTTPTIPGIPVADMAGGLYAALCILGGLLSRELGGATCEHVDVSMTDVSLSLGQVLAASTLFGDTARPGETLLTGEYPCYSVYETADGRYVTVAAIEHHFWEELCRALDLPELVDAHLTDDPAVRESVRETLEETFASRPADDWEKLLGDRDVMFAPVKRFDEALEDPQIDHRGMVHTDVSPPRLGFPARSTDVFVERMSPAPLIGEHTETVIRSLGFGSAKLESLRDDGVVR